MANGKITSTLKAGTGYDAPWLVFNAESSAEMHTLLEEAHAQDLFTAVGRAADAFKRGVALGAGLGARTIEVTTTEDVAKVASKAATAARPAAAELGAKPKAKAAPPAGAPKPAWVK